MYFARMLLYYPEIESMRKLRLTSIMYFILAEQTRVINDPSQILWYHSSLLDLALYALTEMDSAPGLAQLEEHETVMGNHANLRVACSSQAHRMFLPVGLVRPLELGTTTLKFDFEV